MPNQNGIRENESGHANSAGRVFESCTRSNGRKSRAPQQVHRIKNLGLDHLTNNRRLDSSAQVGSATRRKVRPYVSEFSVGAATKRNVANLAKKAATENSSAHFSKTGESTVSSSTPNDLENSSTLSSSDWMQDDFLFARSPAKLNLSLRILGKRTDGFHELETVMIPISLCDRIGIRKRNDGIIKLSVECNVDSVNSIGEDFVTQIPTGEDNLIVKVATAFQKNVGSEFGAEILLRKVIPAGGGLAGASTNAATTLRLLNQIWETRWGSLRLANFAANFGSDIPFFFSDCAAICSGRGEKIAPSPCDSSVWMVVIRPNFGLSTPRVFQELNAPQWQPLVPADPTPQSTGTPPIPDLLKKIGAGRWSQVGPCLQNDLSRPAVRIRSELKALEARLRKTNPIGYQMSGSGSCYFAFYRNKREASASAKQLRNMAVGKTFVVRPAIHTLIA